jgi:hypothetical protein
MISNFHLYIENMYNSLQQSIIRQRTLNHHMHKLI